MARRARKRNGSRKPFGYDNLEERRLLAGDVLAFEHGGHLFVRGDTADNQVEILALPNGDLQISGQNGTTVNGDAAPMILEGQDGQLASDLRVHMGRGDDSILVDGVDISGRAVVYGGSGDDSIGFLRTEVGSDLYAIGWNGNDSISIDEVDIDGRLIVVGGRGADTTGIDASSVVGRTYLISGSGNDDLVVRDSVHTGDVFVVTQSGKDFVATDGLTAGGFLGVYTGSGRDDVFIADSNFRGRTAVNGQGGNDQLELSGDNDFASTPNVRSFEGEDVQGGVPRSNQVFTDLITSGARLGTITELAILTPQLSTLVGALTATGLDAPLNGPGTFTAFAPLNSAFDALPAGTLEGLTNDQLSEILQFHVATSTIFAAELVTLSSVPTLLGSSFSVDVSSGSPVLNGNVTVAQTDIRAKNGVIHLLNEVLLPAG